MSCDNVKANQLDLNRAKSIQHRIKSIASDIDGLIDSMTHHDNRQIRMDGVGCD